MSTRHRSEGRIKTGRWWALLRSPKALPVLFDTYTSAIENRDPDEYLVQVQVEAATPRYRARPWSRSTH